MHSFVCVYDYSRSNEQIFMIFGRESSKAHTSKDHFFHLFSVNGMGEHLSLMPDIGFM